MNALIDARAEIARLRVVVEAARRLRAADYSPDTVEFCPALDAFDAALDALPESTP